MRKRLRKKKNKKRRDYIRHLSKSGIYSIEGVGLIQIDIGKDVIYNINGNV